MYPKCPFVLILLTFSRIIPSIVRDFRPEALVVQCGADCLSKDPLGAFNLTTESITHCIQTLLNASTENKNKIPTLLLGGGGYNISNSARLWTSLTAETLNRKLDNNIPDNKVKYIAVPDLLLIYCFISMNHYRTFLFPFSTFSNTGQISN